MLLPKICGKNGMPMGCNAACRFLGQAFAAAIEAAVGSTMAL